MSKKKHRQLASTGLFCKYCEDPITKGQETRTLRPSDGKIHPQRHSYPHGTDAFGRVVPFACRDSHKNEEHIHDSCLRAYCHAQNINYEEVLNHSLAAEFEVATEVIELFSEMIKTNLVCVNCEERESTEVCGACGEGLCETCHNEDTVRCARCLIDHCPACANEYITEIEGNSICDDCESDFNAIVTLSYIFPNTRLVEGLEGKDE